MIPDAVVPPTTEQLLKEQHSGAVYTSIRLLQKQNELKSMKLLLAQKRQEFKERMENVLVKREDLNAKVHGSPLEKGSLNIYT
jgi:hypothetical protein